MFVRCSRRSLFVPFAQIPLPNCFLSLTMLYLRTRCAGGHRLIENTFIQLTKTHTHTPSTSDARSRGMKRISFLLSSLFCVFVCAHVLLRLFFPFAVSIGIVNYFHKTEKYLFCPRRLKHRFPWNWIGTTKPMTNILTQIMLCECVCGLDTELNFQFIPLNILAGTSQAGHKQIKLVLCITHYYIVVCSTETRIIRMVLRDQNERSSIKSTTYYNLITFRYRTMLRDFHLGKQWTRRRWNMKMPKFNKWEREQKWQPHRVVNFNWNCR